MEINYSDSIVTLFCTPKRRNKMKNAKYHTMRTVSKSKRNNIEKVKFDSPNTPLYDGSRSWLGKRTLIRSSGVTLILWTQQ